MSSMDEKNENLLKSLEATKLQICQLEKNIKTLNEQIININLERKKDFEKIISLEKHLREYKALTKRYKKSEHLNNIFDIFESELNYEPDLVSSKKVGIKKNNIENFECHDNGNSSFYQTDNEIPAEIIMGNFIKSVYVPQKSRVINQRKTSSVGNTRNSSSTIESDINCNKLSIGSKVLHEKRSKHNSDKKYYTQKNYRI